MMRKVRKGPFAIYESEGPDEGAFACSLIWTFSVRRHILHYSLYFYLGNEGPDQPVHIHRLIKACVVRILNKGPFHALRITCVRRVVNV